MVTQWLYHAVPTTKKAQLPYPKLPQYCWVVEKCGVLPGGHEPRLAVA